MKTRSDILRLIEEEDVEFIRLQFTDVFGNLKNIAVTLGQIDRVLGNQFSIEGSALFDELYDPGMNLYLHPVLDSFVILPWRPQQGKVGKFICDVCYRNGELFEMSPRTILKKVLDQAAGEGYAFIVDPECEFFLFHTDDNGTPTTITHEKAGYLDVGPLDLGENARRDMVLTLEQMGFDIESSHHEKGPAQHEIDFTQGEALETADSLMTFKFAIRSIAKRFGLYATFMPKPRTDVTGSGMHLNLSLYKDGKNLFHGEDEYRGGPVFYGRHHEACGGTVCRDEPYREFLQENPVRLWRARKDRLVDEGRENNAEMPQPPGRKQGGAEIPRPGCQPISGNRSLHCGRHGRHS